MSYDQALKASDVEAIPAPFPNLKGVATLKIFNSDQSLGPALALLTMEPNCEIPRHFHERTTEILYVLEGDFIENSISYPPGTEFNARPMSVHGPQATKHGCVALVMFSYPSILDDFKLA